MLDRLHYSINMLLYELGTKKKNVCDLIFHDIHCIAVIWNLPHNMSEISLYLDFVLSYFLSVLLFLDSGNCQSFSFLLTSYLKTLSYPHFPFLILTFAHLWYSLIICFPWHLASSIHSFFCEHLLPNLHGFLVSCCLFSSTPITYTVPS